MFILFRKKSRQNSKLISRKYNGKVLTVVKIDGNQYTVTAIKETIDKTNLSEWQVGDKVNLERAMLGARLMDILFKGMDQIGQCTSVKEEGGSWVFDFEYDPSLKISPLKKDPLQLMELV